MTRKIKKNCVLCGKEYEIYCPNCREGMTQETWKMSFDSENCKNIYNTVASFYAKKIDADEAYTALKKFDLSIKNTFTHSTQNLLAEIENQRTKEVGSSNSELGKVQPKQPQYKAKTYSKKNR